jgi:hypothetical protein
MGWRATRVSVSAYRKLIPRYATIATARVKPMRRMAYAGTERTG